MRWVTTSRSAGHSCSPAAPPGPGPYPLVDGSKRLGWLATATFLEINGIPVTQADNDAVYDFVIGVTVGHEDVGEIAGGLRRLALG